MGKIAFVTGGTGGIGSPICEKLHDDGFTVVAGYFSGGKHERAQAWQAEQKGKGRDMDIAYGDIGDYESATACIEGIIEKHGSIDVLVNNGGITRDGFFKKMDLEKWHHLHRSGWRRW